LNGVFAEIVSKYIAVSSNILKLVNSLAFGLKRIITNISQIVIMISYKGVTPITSLYHLQNLFTEKVAISLEKFWDTANMMSLLLENLNIDFHCTKQDAYSFGLLGDCGTP